MDNIEINTTNSDMVVGGTGYKQPKINRYNIGQYTTYEVLDLELDLLYSGFNGNIKLNISISLLSIWVTLLISCFTTSFPSEFAHGCFVTSAWIAFILGVVLLAAFCVSKKKTTNVYDKITKRSQMEVLDKK